MSFTNYYDNSKTTAGGGWLDTIPKVEKETATYNTVSLYNKDNSKKIKAVSAEDMISLYNKDDNINISWNEYFMGIAELSAKRSKDPVTKVGACIVDENNIIVGIGYNGFPRGCDDNMFPWTKEGEYSDTKFAYVVHAELNAILNSNKTKNCKLYCTEFPCAECFKAIVQSGIKEVIYLKEPDVSKQKHLQHKLAVNKMAKASGVKLTSYNEHINIDTKGPKINIPLPSPEEIKDMAALSDFDLRDILSK